MALSSCSISMRIIRPALRLTRFLTMLFHLITPSLCLLPANVSVLVLIGTVQTVSTAHLNFCQRVINWHTIIDSHCASSSSEPLDTFFVPARIIMLEILPGFKSSTIRYSCASLPLSPARQSSLGLARKRPCPMRLFEGSSAATC